MDISAVFSLCLEEVQIPNTMCTVVSQVPSIWRIEPWKTKDKRLGQMAFQNARCESDHKQISVLKLMCRPAQMPESPQNKEGRRKKAVLPRVK